MPFIFNTPRGTRKLHWTDHSKTKMKQYGLSVSKLLGILRKPERRERGIALGTMAVMKTNKVFFKEKAITLSDAWRRPKKAPGEIWIMYKDTKDQRKIISAWRYPGVSIPGEEIPVPDDIKYFLKSGIWNS